MQGRTLGAYLWKEWREHRVVLLGMVVAVPLLLGLLALVLPRKMFDHRGFAGSTAIACLAIFVVALTTDLVPGEARRGTRAFLERLPGGLGPAFLAKLVLFGAGAALFAAYGYAVGAVAGGAAPAMPSLGVTAGILALAAIWAFALSCALPRGALSLPAAAAFALLLAVPILVCREIEPSWGPQPWWRWESVALWAAGGVVAAWLAFRSRGLLKATRACLAVGAVCAMPYWADAAHYVLVPEPAISSVYLGEGGRYVFLGRVRKAREPGGGTLPPMIVDLASGTSRELPSADRWFRPLSGWRPAQRYLLLGADVYDGRTGGVVHVTDADLREGCRWNTTWRLPDGRRVWTKDGRLECEAADGRVEVLLDSPCVNRSRGLGFEIPQGFYDPSRRRYYARRDLAIRRYQVIVVRPGRWLVRLREGTPFELYDPDADALAPVRELRPDDYVGATFDDGRVFVTRGRAVLLLDPEAGTATPVAAPAGVRVWDWGLRASDGRSVLCLQPESGPFALGRFDPATAAFAITAPVPVAAGVVGFRNDDEVILYDREALYRLRFGSDTCEEIWRVR